jgi:hypothetical protein
VQHACCTAATDALALSRARCCWCCERLRYFYRHTTVLCVAVMTRAMTAQALHRHALLPACLNVFAGICAGDLCPGRSALEASALVYPLAPPPVALVGPAAAAAMVCDGALGGPERITAALFLGAAAAAAMVDDHEPCCVAASPSGHKISAIKASSCTPQAATPSQRLLIKRCRAVSLHHVCFLRRCARVQGATFARRAQCATMLS